MDSAEKLSITVTPAMARMIREKVDDGSFGSASEVIRGPCAPFSAKRKSMPNAWPRSGARVTASLEDKRPAVPLDEAIDKVKSRISQLARDNDDSASRRRS